MSDFFLYFVVINVSVIFYIYIGYPILLVILSLFIRPNRCTKERASLSVTVLISCFNEVDVIKAKIDNCLSLDYPSDLIKFIFLSDGSFDGTDEVINTFISDKIRLIRQEGRLGKSAALNLAKPFISSDIIVFSDANAMYESSAISYLVKEFNDPNVGYVVGASLYNKETNNPAAKSEITYWVYEIFLKQLESKLCSVVGGDGAIYAIRQEFFFTLEKEDISDFVNPMQIIMKGFRGVFTSKAKSYENASDTFQKEAERKKRIVNQSFMGLLKCKAVMNPFKFGLFSFFVISHKLLRWLTSLFLLFIAFGSVYLAKEGTVFFQWLTLLGILLFWLCLIGYLKNRSAKISPVFYYPYYFLMVNMYVTFGIIQALSGRLQYSWNTVREENLTSNQSAVESKWMKFSIALCASLILFVDIFTSLFK